MTVRDARDVGHEYAQVEKNGSNVDTSDRYFVWQRMRIAEPDFIMGGTLKSGAITVTREAAGLGANSGGAIEVITTPNAVGNLWFHMP